jgi:hypothetical protein
MFLYGLTKANGLQNILHRAYSPRRIPAVMASNANYSIADCHEKGVAEISIYYLDN